MEPRRDPNTHVAEAPVGTEVTGDSEVESGII